jgi:hypothetical protein
MLRSMHSLPSGPANTMDKACNSNQIILSNPASCAKILLPSESSLALQKLTQVPLATQLLAHEEKIIFLGD